MFSLNVYYDSQELFTWFSDMFFFQNGSVCVSGGRDRSIVVWDLSELVRGTGAESPDYKPPYTVKDGAHLGWIWDFASIEDRLYSCSWDTYITRWSLQQQLQEDESYK